jgi:hypothetical protein
MHYNLPAATFMRTYRVLYTSGDAQSSTVLFDPQGGSRVVLTSLRITLEVSAGIDIKVGFGTITVAGATGSSSSVAFDGPGVTSGTIVIGNGQGIIGYGAKDEDLTFSSEALPSAGSLTITVTGYQEDASSE